jgi:predicted TIM-barrel fold metal-dependent hydrolase
MIIDAHCHAGPGDGLSHPSDTAAPLDRYLRRADSAGIERTVLFAAFHTDYRFANREVARIVSGGNGRFFGFAMLHASRDAGRIHDLVRESVEEYGFRGIKAHRHDARLTREICDVARGFGLPVLYDVMGEISAVELLAPQYPDVDFIIPHLGSFAGDWWAHVTLVDVLVRHSNVYTDTSGVRYFDNLVEAVRRAGAHKVLFGSDGPWLHPGLELARVRALGLPAVDEDLVVGGNLLRLIQFDRGRASVRSRIARGGERHASAGHPAQLQRPASHAQSSGRAP